MAKMLVENVNVSNLAQAIKGMRNPLESWKDSDSIVMCCKYTKPDAKSPMGSTGLSIPFGVNLSEFNQTADLVIVDFELGEKDKALAIKLIKAGTDHCKFLRQIGFIADITAPMTWWWDFDTYKVATTKNSTSRMHKLGSRPLTMEDFGWDSTVDVVDLEAMSLRRRVVQDINERIENWRNAKEARSMAPTELRARWRAIVDDLPQSYLFKATWSGSYQTLRSVWFSRKGHKQVEFDMFRDVIAELPCGEFITTQ